MRTTEIIWLTVGFTGQFFFFLRFFIQWIVSERKRESVIPIHFWYFSIGGGILLLFYAIYKRDPVFIVGQSMGVLIYARNLFFIYNRKEK